MPYADDAEAEIVSGVLHAFDATDLTHELWNTRMVPARDDLGNFAKFVPPTVANGRVYVASFSNRLHVYGLLGSLPPVTGGAIVGSGALSTATVNLTATGTADWAQWPGFNDKSTGNEQISDLSSLGQGDANTYANDPRTLTWNDGTVTVCGSSTAGASISGTANGFLITVPADTTSRTLNLYVGGSNSRGMLTAQLSDGSAADFVDTGLSSTGQYDGVYTLTYSAASAGQQLTVMWTLYSGSGNVTLQGAALIGAADPQPPSDCVWVDDALPLGAQPGSNGGDSWNWVSSNPTPYSGALAFQSTIASGEHQDYFLDATTTLSVATGDTLFTYVYLDPANVPSEVMLQWNNGSWEHRAYWGADLVGWGTDGTVSRVYMGPLPATGQWVRLAVPAATVGLVGSTLNGMAYTLYGGRATWDYAGKSSSGQLTPTTTTLTSSVNPSTLGSSVTFTATVAGSSPTGSVNFTDGGSSIASCAAVALASGKATCSTSGLAVATHSIVANYGGDANNAASASATLSQVVNKPASTTTLTSSVNPSTAGSSVTFTATVAGSSPTGSVNFTDGGSSIASCAAVALASGKATCTTSGLAVATHSIVANYGGDANNAASASATLSQVVNKPASTTTLTSSVNPSTVGSSVTFTATVAGSSPTGSVNFTDGGSSIASCAAVALASGKAACTTSGLAVATHSIVANYGGDANNTASASAMLSQVVNKAASTTTLTSSVNPSTVGSSVTFTATVAGSSPTGSVNFTDGGSSIASCAAVALASGKAACTPAGSP